MLLVSFKNLSNANVVGQTVIDLCKIIIDSYNSLKQTKADEIYEHFFYQENCM